MAKKKISKKRIKSLSDMPSIKLKKSITFAKSNASKKMRDKEYISKALWDCLLKSDIPSFKEILRTHLELTNKDEVALKTGISRRTLFRMLSDEGNPTLENVSKLISKICV